MKKLNSPFLKKIDSETCDRKQGSLGMPLKVLLSDAQGLQGSYGDFSCRSHYGLLDQNPKH
jgi:hypothetical protein